MQQNRGFRMNSNFADYIARLSPSVAEPCATSEKKATKFSDRFNSKEESREER